MTEVFVYRVENQNCGGMYTGRKGLNDWAEYCEAFQSNWEIESKHPIPDDSLVRQSYRGYVFGFESMKALYRWLYNSDWIEYLRNNGYSISKYKVDLSQIRKVDDIQLVFNPIEKVSQVALSIYGPAEFI